MQANEEWRKIKIRKIAPDKVAEMLQSDNYFVIDVRPLEYARDSSFIKQAVLCPLVYLSEYYKDLPKDCNILITDWAMKQSTIAAKFLAAKGFNVAGVLKGGIERWNADNREVEIRPPQKGSFASNWNPKSMPCGSVE